jgi:hypothetical protein
VVSSSRPLGLLSVRVETDREVLLDAEPTGENLRLLDDLSAVQGSNRAWLARNDAHLEKKFPNLSDCAK